MDITRSINRKLFETFDSTSILGLYYNFQFNMLQIIKNQDTYPTTNYKLLSINIKRYLRIP